jgi:hypothetical protein
MRMRRASENLSNLEAALEEYGCVVHLLTFRTGVPWEMRKLACVHAAAADESMCGVAAEHARAILCAVARWASLVIHACDGPSRR